MVGGRGLRVRTVVDVEGGPQATVEAAGDGALRVLRFSEPITPLLDSIGSMPLPPYIHEPLQSPDEYQTVFAVTPGSAAAPTAGLHFTPALLQAIAERGVTLARIVLHVGLDTFAPVTVDDPTLHPIPRTLPGRRLHGAADQRSPAGGRHCGRHNGVRTSDRRSRAAPGDAIGAFDGETDLLILPGYRFRAVDAMITNFHLPRSTLLMLVAAFAGRERILATYDTAKAEGYRFYSCRRDADREAGPSAIAGLPAQLSLRGAPRGSRATKVPIRRLLRRLSFSRNDRWNKCEADDECRCEGGISRRQGPTPRGGGGNLLA
jgi:S-adenosylmethionine:tRNA ribosyltransferase-isomerase